MSASDGIFGSVDALDAASAPSLDSTPVVVTEPPPAVVPFSSQTQLPGVTWGVQGNPTLSVPARYVTLNDQFALFVRNSVNAVTLVQATIRILQPDGTIGTQQLVLNNPTSDRNGNQVFVNCQEGLLIGVAIDYNTTPVVRGQLYVNFFIVRNIGTASPYQEMLIADYLTPGFKPSWPMGELRASTDGEGYLYGRFGPNPIAGEDATVTNPSTTRWSVQSIQAALQTSATVQQRQVRFIISEGAAVVWTVTMPAQQAPSTLVHYALAPGVNWQSGDTLNQIASMPPDLKMSGNISIQTFTTGLEPGDLWSNIQVAVEEWIDV
jgi:hypothetical protein